MLKPSFCKFLSGNFVLHVEQTGNGLQKTKHQAQGKSIINIRSRSARWEAKAKCGVKGEEDETYWIDRQSIHSQRRRCSYGKNRPLESRRVLAKGEKGVDGGIGRGERTSATSTYNITISLGLRK
jgi:hypothetical protein